MYYRETKKKVVCSNCGKLGHEHKVCSDAKTSFGIINVSLFDNEDYQKLKHSYCADIITSYYIESEKYSNIKFSITDNIKLADKNNNSVQISDSCVKYKTDKDKFLFQYYASKIKFLMVERRHSLGFIQFITGKYNVENNESIINLFEQMTEKEIKNIGLMEYEDLLYYFVNDGFSSKESVLKENLCRYIDAKNKFNELKNADANSKCINLSCYVQNVRPKWKINEWGFPKGKRKDSNEDNISCASREFQEETGYQEGEYVIMNKIEPIEENLFGTNGVPYKHVYYVSLDSKKNDNNYNYDYREIGDVRWFSYQEALLHIRPYHLDKRDVLTRLFMFFMNSLLE